MIQTSRGQGVSVAVVEEFGKHGYADRSLHLLELDSVDQLPDSMEMPGPQFACLLAWDSETLDVHTVSRFARHVLKLGAVSVSVWGQGCERVHDIFDDEFIEISGHRNDEPTLMTTWHSREPLSEAIWYVLFCLVVDDAFEQTCSSILAISIGKSTCAADIRKAFSNPRSFSAEMLRDESPAGD
jgi:hypothetical protein